MPSPMSWNTTILEADLGSAPTALADNNVISNSASKGALALTANITGGTSPTLTVVVYFWNPITSAFELSGDTFVLDPASANVRVLDPNGLILGFTATATGSPTTFTLDVGER